jgi:hypothetical protein
VRSPNRQHPEPTHNEANRAFRHVFADDVDLYCAETLATISRFEVAVSDLRSALFDLQLRADQSRKHR